MICFRTRIHPRPVIYALLALLVITSLVGPQASAEGLEAPASTSNLVAIPAVYDEYAVAQAPASYRVAIPAVYSGYDVVPPHILGVQMYGSLADSNVSYEALNHSRAYFVRWELSWASVEPVYAEPPQYHWDAADQNIRLACAQGLHPIVTILSNPSWAAMGPPGRVDVVYSNGPIKREHLPRFAQFVQALVERYDGDGVDDAPGSPVVKYFEFYNEPDKARQIEGLFGGPFWGGKPEDYDGDGLSGAQLYAEMLQNAYPAVKRANPEAQVLIGGLAYDNWLSPDGQYGAFNPDFLDEVLEKGGGEYFDVMNFHYYPHFRARWQQPNAPDIIGKVKSLEAKLAEHDLSKPIVCTEVGLPSEPDEKNCPDCICPRCNEGMQSRYVTQTAVRAMASGLEAVIWWPWRDLEGGLPSLGLTLYNHGLLDENLQPKPSLEAFRAATLMLQNADLQGFEALPRESYVLEKYHFARADGSTLDVLWTSWLWEFREPLDPQPWEDVSLPLQRATLLNKYGVPQRTVSDADDGSIDGHIRVTAGPDPIFVLAR